jgi:hypothetical protein
MMDISLGLLLVVIFLVCFGIVLGIAALLERQ